MSVTTETAVAERGLGRASAGNVIWNGATFVVSKLLVLVTTAVLARLLVPDDFGLVGIGLLVIGYLDLVNDFGISAAVVQHRGDDEHTHDVAFAVNMLLGFALTTIGLLGAPLVAQFFRDERATDVVRVLALTLLITSLRSIHEARLRRSMRFRRRLVPEMSRAVAKGGVSIALALSGLGVWSLVWGQLAGELTAAILYWIAFPWRPKPTLDRVVTRRLMGFGSHIAMVGILGTVLRNVDYLLIGRVLGTRALGLYTLAFRMPQLVVEGIATIVGQVAFPAFARVQDDPERLRSGMLRGLRLSALAVVPLGVGLALVAGPFIRAVYGERWESAIDVMRLLAVYMVIQAASRLFGDVYKAIGRARLLSGLAVLKLAITVPLLAFAVNDGIVAVAWAQVVAAIACTVIDLVVAVRTIEVTWRELLAAYAPSLRAGAALTLVGVVAGRVTAGGPSWLALTVVAAAGAVAYVAALRTFDRPAFDEVARLLRRRGGTRPQAAVSGQVGSA